MDTNDREKYRQLRQQQRERQLHIIRLSILLSTGVILMFAGLAILGYVHRQTSVSDNNIYENVSETYAGSESYPDTPSSDKDTEMESVPDTSSTNSATESEIFFLSDDDYLGILKQQISDFPEVKKILKDPSRYPVSLLKALSKNMEMLDFVLDYPQKHDLSCAETIGDDFVKGSIPTLFQWDERWGYAPYGSDTIIAVSGCGPTALSMVISGLMQDPYITPAVIADYASANGYLDENLDTAWELMTVGVQHFGISGTMLGLDENVMAATLASGSPIICSMGPGIFTSSGHFIVLTGYQDGSFTVHDPASKMRSSKTYTFDEFSDQIKNMWYFVRN